jgi:hypothetical protein
LTYNVQVEVSKEHFRVSFVCPYHGAQGEMIHRASFPEITLWEILARALACHGKCFDRADPIRNVKYL